MTARLQHRPGELLCGTLEVLAEVGRGAYGTVYRCHDRRGGPHRAVKEMHLVGDGAELASAVRNFQREARLLAHLDHPAIPHAEPLDVEGPFWIDSATGLEVVSGSSGAVAVARRHFIVMEWIDGTSLEDHIRVAWDRGEPLPSAPVLGWIRQLAEALAYLHAQGLVHGDVKPRNVLIRRDDSAAMLVDFGLCRPVAETSGYGTVPMRASGPLGTPGYAPPDPVEQEHPVPASDLHALAMTARRALTGLDPTDPTQLRTLRGQRLSALRTGLLEHEGAAIDRAIASEARQRPASMAAFIELLSEPPVPVARPSRTGWLEARPPELDAGRMAAGETRDLVLVLRDRRPGVRPAGLADSTDRRLRILPSTAHGNDIALHLTLHMPRGSAPGPVALRLLIRTDEEELIVPVRCLVDPALRPPSQPGCLTLPAALLGWRG